MRKSSAAVLAILLIMAAAAVAQDTPPDSEYHLGAGDVVQLNVLQQPTLDRSLVIRPDGTVVVPLVGEIKMAGLTVRDAESQLRQKLRLFNREINDVSLTVTQYNALRIYVLGAVVKPGSYTFDASPTLWDVLREAGGASDDANLTAVRVISSRDGTTSSATYDVSGVLTGHESAAPVYLHAGDTVVVPGSQDVSVAPDVGVQVFGGVTTPGTYVISEPTRLLSVLMLAGAPLESADLGKVWWIHAGDSGRYVSRSVNVKRFIEKGDLASNPLVNPGDTVRVPQHGGGFFRTVYPLLLGTLTSAAAVAIAVQRMGGN